MKANVKKYQEADWLCIAASTGLLSSHEIAEETVEKTWQEDAGLSPIRANKGIMKIGNNWPELIAFVTKLLTIS